MQSAEGLRISIKSGRPLPDDLTIVAWSVHGRDNTTQETFHLGDLLARDDGSFEVPSVLRLKPGMGFDIEASTGEAQVAGREFVVRDLGRDDLPGLRERNIGAVYETRFNQSTSNGMLSGSQRGIDAVGIDPNGKSARFFSGRGTLTRQFGPLLLNLTLSKIERTTTDGTLVQEQSIGSGSWQALAPAEGNGTVLSFRQRLDGNANIPLADGSSEPTLKYTTTVLLNGTFSVNGTARAFDEPVYWIEWLHPVSHEALWTRQRPAKLELAASEGYAEGPAVVGGFGTPPALFSGLIPTPTFEDDRLAFRVAGTELTFRVSPRIWVPVGDHKVMAYAWDSQSGDDVQIQASGEAGIAGLPVRWTVSRSDGDHSWTSTGTLKSLRDSR